MSPTEQDLLQRLIQISSVNPAFVGDSRQHGGETDLADFLVDFLEKNHWPWLRQTVMARTIVEHCCAGSC